jgi:hypothetical protein
MNMKKLLLYSIASLFLISCNSRGDSKSGTVEYSVDLESIDSLANTSPAIWKNLSTIVEGVGHSGNFSSKIDSASPFSVVLETKVSDIAGGIPKEVKFSAYGLALQSGSKAILVVSASDNVFYGSAVFDTLFNTTDQWQKMNTSFLMPKNLKENHVLKAYVWNDGKGELLVDDLNIEFVY